jgi:hypothetical protein
MVIEVDAGQTSVWGAQSTLSVPSPPQTDENRSAT